MQNLIREKLNPLFKIHDIVKISTLPRTASNKVMRKCYESSIIPMLDTSTPVWSVSSLNASARDLLEGHFQNIWIEGEISNFAKPSSGHFYFTLKDDLAQIRCAMFRGRNRSLTFEPKDGMHVLACASVSLYEPRGDYQLIVEALQNKVQEHFNVSLKN